MSLQDQIAAGFGRLATAIFALKAEVDALGGGGGGGAVAIQSVEVDFGSGAMSKTFVVPVAGAALGQKVMALVSLDMPIGVAQDELEMDPITCSAAVQSAGVVRVIASAQAPISGKRSINLILG